MVKHRVAASLVVALVSFALLAPAVSAPDPKLPACCRRHGKHHCSDRSDSGTAIQAAKCGAFPSAQSLPVPVILPSPQATISIAANHLIAFPQFAQEHVTAPDRAHRKRGPPSLLA